MPMSHKDELGLDLSTGSRHYRAFVGSAKNYDLVSAMQFNLLTFIGLREHHFLLDIGCGSLRAGRLFIPYLLTGKYFGLEPERWLVAEGIKNELGEELIRIKKPTFVYDDSFTLTAFNQKFDFILAQSIFSHASQKQIAECMHEAKEVMKPAAIFAATFLEGESNYSQDDWFYPGCVTYTFERFADIVRMEGLDCKRLDWYHPNEQTWTVIFFPENASNLPPLEDTSKLPIIENKLKGKLELCGRRLSRTRERLVRLEQHPYIKVGRLIQQALQNAGLVR